MPLTRSVYLLIIINILKLTSISGYNLSVSGRLNFTGLAEKYGLTCEEYDVITEDGYINKLFHIPGDKTRPVLLMHGVLDSSDTYIIRGNGSMVATLARSGYDVWVGNKRGNRYSRRHVTLNPDIDREYWNFTFHEIAIYDLPATIDHILNHTGQSKLSCIGHSQGNTIFYVLGSMRPEYNEKIGLMIAMAPIAFLYHLKVPAKLVVQLWPLIGKFLSTVGQEEVFSDNALETNLLRTLCSKKNAYDVCGKPIFFALAGYDPEELEEEFLPLLVRHYPSGTSKKGGTHLLQQGLKREFSQMDYGFFGNLKAYNSSRPPNYELDKVTMKIALLAGANDKMCSLTDVRILKSRLPNVVDFHVMEWERFNHIDFTWGRHMDKNLFPKVLSLLKKFS